MEKRDVTACYILNIVITTKSNYDEVGAHIESVYADPLIKIYDQIVILCLFYNLLLSNWRQGIYIFLRGRVYVHTSFSP